MKNHTFIGRNVAGQKIAAIIARDFSIGTFYGTEPGDVPTE